MKAFKHFYQLLLLFHSTFIDLIFSSPDFKNILEQSVIIKTLLPNITSGREITSASKVKFCHLADEFKNQMQIKYGLESDIIR